jgi:predicted outer membrane repeat protein
MAFPVATTADAADRKAGHAAGDASSGGLAPPLHGVGNMATHLRMGLCVAFAAAACAVSSAAGASDGVVGPGNCNAAGFASVLAAVDGSGGGTLSFNCGTASIAFAGYQTIANTVTIDGGGTITFDGGNASAFLQVFASAHATLKRLTLQHGVYTGGVHALENFGTLALDHVRVLANTSSDTPLANYGTLVVRSSTFSGNAANSASSGDGGAIAHSGTALTVEASTFDANSAGHQGGAIFASAPLSIVNSTFSGNSGAAGGGAIYQTGSGDSSVEYATIVSNTATFGAGLYNDGASSTLTVSRSIVAANTSGNCDGVLASGGYNLSDDTGCGGTFTGPGDLTGQNLPMGALADNGGPTHTRLPLSGNPALNHVPAGACAIAVDQRGAGRPFGAGCDSGAVEVGGAIDLIFANGFD